MEWKNVRPYDYQENLVRENSRKRKNRKQLCFSDDEVMLIQQNMQKLGIENFSYYMRAVACYNAITPEDVRLHNDELV